MHELSGMSLWRHRSNLTETFCSWRAAALQRPDSWSFSFVSLPLVRWFRQVHVPCQDWLKCSLAILCRVSSCEYNEQMQHRTCVSKQEHDSENWKPRSLVSIFSFFFIIHHIRHAIFSERIITRDARVLLFFVRTYLLTRCSYALLESVSVQNVSWR